MALDHPVPLEQTPNRPPVLRTASHGLRPTGGAVAPRT